LIKIFAGAEPIVGVPVVLDPVQVELAVLEVGVDHALVAVVVAEASCNCTKYHPCHHPSNTLRVEFYLRSYLQYFAPSISTY
jgi:hypothetical protein